MKKSKMSRIHIHFPKHFYGLNLMNMRAVARCPQQARFDLIPFACRRCHFCPRAHSPLSKSMREPSSSKSFLVIHILLKALRLDTVAPPTQHEYFLFLGAISVIVTSLLASFWMLLCSLSLKPVSRDVPPATMIELYSVFLTSISHFLIELMTISCTPGHSRPILSGLNNISGALNFSEPSYMI